jgi:hypothetical protein
MRRGEELGPAEEKKGGGNFLEKRGNVWNEKESFTLSSNRSPWNVTIGIA